MSDENNTPPPEPAPAPAPEQPTESQVPDGYLHQDEVNKIVAREVAKAKRQAKKAQPKPEEPTTSTVQSDEPPAWAQGMLSKIETLEANLEADKLNAGFASEIAGIEMDDDDRAMLELTYKQDRDLFGRRLAKLKSQMKPPEPKGPGFNGLGAPNPVPAADRATNPSEWTADDVARYRKEGTFMKRMSDFRASLPGGGGGLFPAKSPVKK